jgi:hypothetical protein
MLNLAMKKQYHKHLYFSCFAEKGGDYETRKMMNTTTQTLSEIS